MVPQRSTEGTLRFHPLTFLVEGDDVVVGRVDTDSYGVFPTDGAALVRRLADGEHPDAAAAWYQRTYGEPVDVADLLDTLAELGFLAEDGADAVPVRPVRPVRWQRLGRAAFSPLAWLLYTALVTAAVLVCLRQPALRPHHDNVFFSDYLLAVELGIALGQLPLFLVHELFHVLAGRRLGLSTRVRLGRRLYFVVFETVMDGLVVVPKRQRYLPMLAGMLADVLTWALLTLAALALRGPGGAATLTSDVCLALAFTAVPRLAMQFFFFLRTDLYYLVTTLCGCVDLHSTARGVVRNARARLLRRLPPHDPQQWHPNDVRAARWYAPLYVLGYGAFLALLVSVLLPITWRFASTAATTLWQHDWRSAAFWDATGLLLLTTAQPAVAGALGLRERWHQRQDQQPAPSAQHPPTPDKARTP